MSVAHAHPRAVEQLHGTDEQRQYVPISALRAEGRVGQAPQEILGKLVRTTRARRAHVEQGEDGLRLEPPGLLGGLCRQDRRDPCHDLERACPVELVVVECPKHCLARIFEMRRCRCRDRPCRRRRCHRGSGRSLRLCVVSVLRKKTEYSSLNSKGAEYCDFGIFVRNPKKPQDHDFWHV
jgi:hypothetical protein